jgi:hypothetical protein
MFKDIYLNMNNQNILKKGSTKLGVILDNSEFYDFEVVDGIIGKIDIILDQSEFYDYEVVYGDVGKLDIVLDASELYDYEIIDGKIDVTLDISELYDYKFGDSKIDYEFIEEHPQPVTINQIITEDNFAFMTEDNYIIEYNDGR